jgi:hypothetical protein
MYLDYFVSDLPGRSPGYEQGQHRRFVELLAPVEYPAVEVTGRAGVHIQLDELSVVHDTASPVGRMLPMSSSSVMGRMRTSIASRIIFKARCEGMKHW